MALPDRVSGLIVEGLAIVSSDGMIADSAGVQPDALKLEADQRFFSSVLDAADVLVHGRYSGEGGPHAPRRKRIVLTRRIPGVAPDPDNSNAVLWNPAGAPFAAAWELIAVSGNRLAVIGGTDVFGLFLQRGYDVFHLSRTERARYPGGRPIFPGVPDRSPEELLAGRLLKPDTTRVLDPSLDLTLTTWRP